MKITKDDIAPIAKGGTFLATGGDDTLISHIIIEEVLDHHGEVSRLFDGKVVDVERKFEGGYDIGRLKVEPFGGADTFEIAFKNEYLTAIAGERILALTPDLICLIDHENAQPITAETLRYGQRVTVVGIGAPESMRTAKALEFLSPKYFGSLYDSTPIESL